jgi:hypothetical protein
MKMMGGLGDSMPRWHCIALDLILVIVKLLLIMIKYL